MIWTSVRRFDIRCVHLPCFSIMFMITGPDFAAECSTPQEHYAVDQILDDFDSQNGLKTEEEENCAETHL